MFLPRPCAVCVGCAVWQEGDKPGGIPYGACIAVMLGDSPA